MDAHKLQTIVNTKTLQNLGQEVIEDIQITPNGKVKVLYTNANVKWFINFFQCFHALNYQYNLKLAPVKTSFAKLKDAVANPQESSRLATLKVRLVSECEVIFDRYHLEKLKYFKNTIFKEVKEIFYDDSDVLKLSKKEFAHLKNHLYNELLRKYGRNGHILDVLGRIKAIDYEELFD
ncbi:MAG: hypothetical protein ACQESH_04965 [Campylobacterota bacterium]